MLDAGKKNVVGILVNAMDYEAAVEFVVRAAKEKRNATVAAQAIHAIMMGATDAQGVRWGINLLHKTRLRDRVYGPNLTLAVLARAEQEGLPVYFLRQQPAHSGKTKI